MTAVVRKTILLVDSYFNNRRIYRHYLLQDNRQIYTIAEAEFGEQVLEICQQQCPDLILISYLLTDMNGLEVLGQLKAIKEANSLPILILVDRVNENVARQAVESGAFDCLIKENITPVSLQLAVQKAIAQTHKLQQLEKLLQQTQNELERRKTARTTELERANRQLQTVYEELQVADEELRLQNEELTYNRQVIVEERQRYQDLFEFAPDGYLVTDTLGIILETNQAASILFSINKQYLIGKPLAAFIAREERESFRERLTRMQNLSDWEVSIQPRNRASLSTAVAVTSIYNLQGQPIGFRWLFRDMSLRKQTEQKLQMAREELEKRVAERTVELSQANMLLQQQISAHQLTEMALREREQLLQAIINNSTAVIYLKDIQGRYLLVNRQYENLFHITNDRVQGKTDFEILPEAIAEIFWTNDQQVLTANTPLTFDESVPLDDGIHTYISSKFPLFKETGISYAVCSMATDITEKKRLEAQFLQAQRLESLGTLASGIAHDFNNILTPILTITQLLSFILPNLDEENRKLLCTVEESTKRGVDLVKQILSFTRGLEGQRAPIEINQAFEEIEQILKNTFPKSIEISIARPTQSLSILADATQFNQVLLNLCVNARDAMPDGGILSLEAKHLFVDEEYARQNLDTKVGFYAVISVSDTGCGIPKENLERIFEPFFTTKETGKGTGLGLSTVLGIITNHDGILQVHSEVGKGTKFKIYLPAVDIHVTQETSAAEIPTGNGELILVVDDEIRILEMVKTVLESYNYKVLSASNGVEALSLYTTYQDEVSVVLMDVQMPSMGGLDTIYSLQQVNPFIKIIVNSGLFSQSELTKVSSTVKAFLSKPYTVEALLSTIKNVLESADS
ncbi:response regulator [Scytonema sp. UIC 10036]|nr:response regulator [Scytonema sp. UIC 10036]